MPRRARASQVSRPLPRLARAGEVQLSDASEEAYRRASDSNSPSAAEVQASRCAAKKEGSEPPGRPDRAYERLGRRLCTKLSTVAAEKYICPSRNPSGGHSGAKQVRSHAATRG